MLRLLFGGDSFTGSWFDTLPIEFFGWCIMAVSGPFLVTAVMADSLLAGAAVISIFLIGAGMVACGYAYRCGFRSGRAYEEPVIVRPSIGPP